MANKISAKIRFENSFQDAFQLVRKNAKHDRHTFNMTAGTNRSMFVRFIFSVELY